MNAKAWRFVQQAGETKELILSGLDAPFGRPRQKPVVTDKIEVRENTVYYAGSQKPTRHIFGVRYEPWELNGRIGDRNSTSSMPDKIPQGPGYAKAMVDYIKRFVSDQQPVTAQWGDILSAQAFIKSFTPEREAEYEVPYRMVVLVDTDESTPKPVQRLNSPRTARDSVQAALGALLQSLPINTLRALNVPRDSYKPSMLDQLDTLVATFNGAIATVISVVGSIESIEKALSSDLRRLRAGIGQLRTAAISLLNLYESFQIDAAIIRRSWTTDVDWMGGRADSDVSLVAALAALEDTNKRAEIAERGQAFSSYVAKFGDSWESIAQSTLGGVDKADKIRQANGITYGTQPQPGRSYKIPFAN